MRLVVQVMEENGHDDVNRKTQNLCVRSYI
jgi:hypothetical protein